MDRENIITSLTQHPRVSVLIVGAGINGAGTFRDLALNKVDTLLIDRGDICSGASAASSRMAHGGIRYLENGEFALVREAVEERNRMIRNAPHLVKPLPTTIPIFKFWSGLLNAPLKFLGWRDAPSERGALIIKLGLIMYDAYTRSTGTVPKHTFLGKQATKKRFPKFNNEARYSATYYDGSIQSPERYNLEVVLDAEGEGEHARALNYVSFLGMDGGKARLRDEVSGTELLIEADLIINAAGPWIDLINANLGIERKYIGGTKGSHLVLDNPELREAIGENEIFFENKDGRIVLIFPFEDKVMIGTSDLPIVDPDTARCESGEVTYFFDMMKRVFPTIKADASQVIYRFSGVRPLARSDSKLTGQITRNHSIKVDEISGTPIFSLVGGKWTSYRRFSEQATDKTLELLGKQRIANTKDIAIGAGYSAANTKELDPKLMKRYGPRAAAIQAEQPDGGTPLSNYPEMTIEEIRYLVANEKVIHLDDLLQRRTLLAYLGKLTKPLVNELAEITARGLGWDNDKKSSEIERTLAILEDKHGITI